MKTGGVKRIGFSAAGLLGVVLLLAGGAHAEAVAPTNNQSSSNVTVQNSQTSVHVSSTSPADNQPGAFVSNTSSTTVSVDPTSEAASVSSTSIDDTSTLDAASQTQALAQANIQEGNDQASTSTTPSDFAASQTLTEDAKLTLATKEGVQFSMRKLVKQSDAQVSTSETGPSKASSSSNPRPLPKMPQGAFVLSNGSALATSISRGGLDFVPKTLAPLATITLQLLLVIICLALVPVASGYLRDLLATGFARAPRGPGLISFSFAFPKSGFSMGSLLVRNPLFVTPERLVAWR